MTYVLRSIGNREYKFFQLELDLTEQVKDIAKYTDEENVAVSLTWLKFMGTFRKIRRLILTDGAFYGDIRQILPDLSGLKELQIENLDSEKNFTVDLSLLPSLEYLYAYSSQNFVNADRCPSLKTVIINRCGEKNLEKLRGCGIDSLEIDHGKLRSLEGIEDLPLKVLAVRDQPELTGIGKYLPATLKMLEISFCRRISGFTEPFPQSLEYLMLDGRNHYPTISFLRSIPSLRRAVIGVFIDDHDLSPLTKLENAAVLRKCRDYNIPLKSLPTSEKQYLPEDIPTWRYIYSDTAL